MSTREAFLSRVRQAVSEGNRLAATAPLPERGRIGYQGAADGPLERFCAELRAAGGVAWVVSDAAAALERIRALLRDRQLHKLLVGRGGLLADCDVAAALGREGYDVLTTDSLQASSWRDRSFAAQAGISNVAHLIAETGSVVMATSPDEPRSLSLLPPVHIALARAAQLLPDLFDLFDLFAPMVADRMPDAADNPAPPSCLTIITGPSKTGDIELKLVTGVHGPGELHVIVID